MVYSFTNNFDAVILTKKILTRAGLLEPFFSLKYALE